MLLWRVTSACQLIMWPHDFFKKRQFLHLCQALKKTVKSKRVGVNKPYSSISSASDLFSVSTVNRFCPRALEQHLISYLLSFWTQMSTSSLLSWLLNVCSCFMSERERGQKRARGEREGNLYWFTGSWQGHYARGSKKRWEIYLIVETRLCGSF